MGQQGPELLDLVGGAMGTKTAMAFPGFLMEEVPAYACLPV
ncbi:hypothetical protein P872_08625 [Rhodonellum psychrophilum GCM71 = DSM 17998]|uniref:Uncharacterized protein n=1 Tax=Rhodonellum psychrophilum GCM71 = DSM 17998 TaxID=1123057 RepID=U5BVZ0_9BACT|nr:hypothetical protein P872_08625 [Rhodonellum psychrophilum GCM71 = DSM 17998]